MAGVVALDKVYDGTNAASINTSGAVLTGKFGTDDVAVGILTGTFADKNAGTAKLVTASAAVLSGADAVNYNLVQPAGLAASIMPRSLVVGATGIDKVYDAGTTAAVALNDNRIAGDVFGVSAAASFLDKNAGVNKFVNVSGITLSGLDAANYSANTSAATFATVSKAALVVAATAQSKVYDGSTAASVAVSDNRLAGDVLTVSTSAAAFSDKNAGADKTVTVGGIALSGADAANYDVHTSATTTASIEKATLTVRATGIAKTYDGSMAATVAVSDNRVAGDALTLSYGAAAFSDKNAGTGKTVTLGALAVSGADAGNYALNPGTVTTTADIAKAVLNVTASGQSKLYDGSTAAQVTLADNRIAGDSLVVHADANFRRCEHGERESDQRHEHPPRQRRGQRQLRAGQCGGVCGGRHHGSSATRLSCHPRRQPVCRPRHS